MDCDTVCIQFFSSCDGGTLVLLPRVRVTVLMTSYVCMLLQVNSTTWNCNLAIVPLCGTARVDDEFDS